MNIGFDAKRAFYNQSGLGNYSRSTIELLSRYFPANKYFLFTPSIENAIKFDIKNNSKILEPQKILSKFFKSYWRSFRLARNIKKNKLDIYHGLSNELPHKAYKTGAKTIVTIHDLIYMRYPEHYNKIDRTIYYQKSKYACDIADTIIAVSEQTKSDIVQYFKVNENKIDVVYQGCNPIFYNESNTTKNIETAQKYKLPEKYILYVGIIEERKNALSILKAVQKFKINISVIIIGEKTPYQELLEDYIAEKKMKRQVFIHNNIPFHDFPSIYQQSAMFVYPSVFEGFGIPIIEALNSKVPVITTKGGCFSESGGMSSLYVESNNVDELAGAIQKVMEDNELREKMINEGYEYVQKFKEEKVARNIMNVYLKQ